MFCSRKSPELLGAGPREWWRVSRLRRIRRKAGGRKGARVKEKDKRERYMICARYAYVILPRSAQVTPKPTDWSKNVSCS
jgi:hypothetical protein